MDPKSGKPLRLFVNPFALWTEFALKSGEAMLASAQASVARGRTPKVAVITDADVPRAKASRKAKGKKQRAKR
jgi:hypothetical protein